MEKDGAERIAESDQRDEQHLIRDRGHAVPGKEIHHVGDAVLEARKDEDGHAEHSYQGVAEHVRSFFPHHHGGVHQHAAHE